MKTSLTDTAALEAYLQGENTGENLVTEARLLLDENLRAQLKWQKHTHVLIQAYGRKKLRQDITAVHDALFTQPQHAGFRRRIMRFFGK